MSGKKPVWVDESAHAILKKYAALKKRPMVEVASRLVIEKLSQLDVAMGQAQPVAAATLGDSEVMQKPVKVKAGTANRRRKANTAIPDSNAKDVRFVGGVWLV